MSQGFTRGIPIDVDSTFAADSDFIVPSQKAVKTIYDGVNVANGTYVKTALNASGSAPIYAARAWGRINQVGTHTLKSSGNITSITDIGLGASRLTFTTAMSNANYTVVSNKVVGTAAYANDHWANNILAASFDLTNTYNGAYYDSSDVYFVVFGN